MFCQIHISCTIFSSFQALLENKGLPVIVGIGNMEFNSSFSVFPLLPTLHVSGYSYQYLHFSEVLGLSGLINYSSL